MQTSPQTVREPRERVDSRFRARSTPSRGPVGVRGAGLSRSQAPGPPVPLPRQRVADNFEGLEAFAEALRGLPMLENQSERHEFDDTFWHPLNLESLLAAGPESTYDTLKGVGHDLWASDLEYESFLAELDRARRQGRAADGAIT